MQRLLVSISRALWSVSCISVSVNWATDANVIHEALAAASAEESLDHEVEPENVQEEKPANERKQHVQHWEIHIRARVLPAVALSVETIDNVPGEEPEAEVDPGQQHQSIAETLHIDVGDIDGQLEEGDNQVSNIMHEHRNAPLRQHIERVGEEDQWPGHQVVQHILWEVCTISMEHDRV